MIAALKTIPYISHSCCFIKKYITSKQTNQARIDSHR